MRSLLEIQQEVRDMEKALKEISGSIRGISDDIQALREAGQDAEIDYKLLAAMARNMPFQEHPIGGLGDPYVRKRYIEALLCLVSLDRENMVEKLVFIQWILGKARLDVSLEEVYGESLQLEKEILMELEELIPEKYKICLIVDALMAANINGPANREALEFIAHLCEVFGMGKEQVEVYSLLAKIALLQDGARLSGDKADKVLAYQETMGHYMDAQLVEKIIISQRRIVAVLGKEVLDGTEVLWNVKMGEAVKNGDLILTYEINKKAALNGQLFMRASGAPNKNSRVEIRATSSGKCYRIRWDNKIYIVIYSAYDRVDSIREWVKGQKA